MLYVDGHVGFAKDSISPSVWKAVATRDNDEIIDGSAF